MERKGLSPHILVAKTLCDQGDEERLDPICPDRRFIKIGISQAQHDRLTKACRATKMSQQRFLAEAMEAYISYHGVGVTDEQPPEQPQPRRDPKQAKESAAYLLGVQSPLSWTRRSKTP